MSVPPGTEMFQFPGFASPPYVFRWRYPKGVGCPIRTSTDQRLLAAPRGFSQRATSFIASWCQGIHRMPFSRSRSSSPDLIRGTPPCTETILSGQWSVLSGQEKEPLRTAHLSHDDRDDPAHADSTSLSTTGSPPDQVSGAMAYRWRAHSISEHTPLAGGRPIRTAHPVRHASRHAQRRTRT
jgi:hypothetical protein